MPAAPRLETRRLVLRPARMDDAPDIFAYARNPQVLRYTTGTTPRRLEETESFVRGLIDKPAGAYAWAVCLKPAPAVIGVVEFGVGDGVEGSVDYALAEPYWNQGIMTEAVRAVLDWAFGAHPSLDCVMSSAMTANPASTRVQQKCGMHLVRRENESWPKFGHPVELAVCAITRAEWATTRRGPRPAPDRGAAAGG